MHTRRWAALAMLTVAAGGGACANGASGSDESSTSTSSGATGGAGGGGGEGMAGGGQGGDGSGGLNFGTGGGNEGGNSAAEVYGHSPDTLYRLDPVTNAITVVGTFGGCPNIIDLAIDANKQMLATASGGLYRINPKTAVCTHIKDGSYPNSLSFVPVGTLDPNVEALVGYNGNSYVRIDTVSGTITTVADAVLPNGYYSSGDIVSVIDGGTYLTVTGNGCSDCLLEVDPSTGAMIKNWGSVNYGEVYGLAYWGGSAYGFSNGGELFKISFGATSVTATLIPFANAPNNLQFWGAGSSTDVPVSPPK